MANAIWIKFKFIVWTFSPCLPAAARSILLRLAIPMLMPLAMGEGIRKRQCEGREKARWENV
jgi:hypothetical protein